MGITVVSMCFGIFFLSNRKYIARVVLNSSLIRCQVMNYLFGLDLYFKNAGNAIKDKEQDVFKNMLEMTLRSRNEEL